MREEVIERIEKEKIIAIVRGVKKEKLPYVAEALYNGGIRLMEITYSANGAVHDADIASMIADMVAAFGNDMYIGAGTVLTDKQVELTKEAGGRFVISPDVYESVIKRTRELGMVSIPGAITPTEVRTALRFGADFVKLFPIGKIGGAEYVKAILAPLAGTKFLAVGGIHDGNMSEYLRAGVVGFGIGANIVPKSLVETGDYRSIAELAKTYVELVK